MPGNQCCQATSVARQPVLLGNQFCQDSCVSTHKRMKLDSIFILYRHAVGHTLKFKLIKCSIIVMHVCVHMHQELSVDACDALHRIVLCGVSSLLGPLNEIQELNSCCQVFELSTFIHGPRSWTIM